MNPIVTSSSQGADSHHLAVRLNEEASLARLRGTVETGTSPNLAEILRKYGIAEDCLEIGCGTGRILRKIGRSCIGVDFIAANCIECGKAGLEVVLADANRGLPFEDEAFTAVVCSHTLEHLRNPLGSLEEMRRILKPGGYLVLCLPTYRSLVRSIRDDYFKDHESHIYAFDVKSITRLAGFSGLRLMEFKVDLPHSHKSRLAKTIQDVVNRRPSSFMPVSNAFWVVLKRD